MGNFENKTILIVDDYPINVELYKFFVKMAEGTAVAATNGKECLEIVKSRKIDLILMDLHMPEMDGITTTEAVRLLPEGRNIGIIGITGSEDKEEHDLCIRAGMDSVIAKQVLSPETLIELGSLCFQNLGLKTDITTVHSTLSPQDRKTGIPALDYNKVLQEFDGDDILLNNLLTEFSTILNQQITRIKNAFAENNLACIRNEAHSIKGGAANLCALPLSEAARELETACKGNADQQCIGDCIQNLIKQIELTIHCIEQVGKE